MPTIHAPITVVCIRETGGKTKTEITIFLKMSASLVLNHKWSVLFCSSTVSNWTRHR